MVSWESAIKSEQYRKKSKVCKTRGVDKVQTFWNLDCVKTFDHHLKNHGKLLKSSELHLYKSF